MAPPSSNAIDDERKTQIAKDYLLRLAEMREWLVNVIPKEEFPDVSDLELFLADGVVIATLAALVCPEKFNQKLIFDKTHTTYQEQRPLNFRHTDNINMFFKFTKEMNFPKVFLFETTDLYERKNLPKVIYCLYALSMFLYKKGLTPRLQNLTGKMEFSEEQIKKVKTALDAYGIQMPKFHTIGGILATELSVDDAALHAAILLINQELDKNDSCGLMSRLQDHAAMLEHISPERIQDYYKNLKNMKDSKVAETEKLGKADEDLDVYDKMLTQMEIQSGLSTVNLSFLLKELTAAIKSGNIQAMCNCIIHPECGLHGVNIGYKEYYFKSLKVKLSELSTGEFKHEDVRLAIQSSNADAEKDRVIDDLIKKLQTELKNPQVDHHEIMNLLSSCQNSLPLIVKDASVLYCHVLGELLLSSSDRLPSSPTFVKTLEMLHPLSSLNCEVEKSGRLASILQFLMHDSLSLTKVDSSLEAQYAERMKEVQELNVANSKTTVTFSHLPPRFYLTTKEVQESVLEVNSRMEISRLLSNSACTPDSLFKILCSKEAKYENVIAENKLTYQEALITEIEKRSSSGLNLELSHETIQNTIDTYNSMCREARSLIPHVTRLNDLVRKSDYSKSSSEIFSLLEKCSIVGLLPDCTARYATSLHDAVVKQIVDSAWEGWCEHSLPSNSQKFYFNHKTDEIKFLHPLPSVPQGHGYLSRPHIQALCNKTTAGHNREMYYSANVVSICQVQAFISALRFTSILAHRPEVMLARSFIRGYVTMVKHASHMASLSQHYETGSYVTTYIHSVIYHRRYLLACKKMKENVASIIKLQTLVRTEMCYNDYSSLVQSDSASVVTLSKYLRFLELDANDLRDEKMLFTLGTSMEQLSREISDLNKDCEVLDSTLTFTTESRLNVQQMSRRKQGMFSWLGKKQQSAAVFSGQESIERERLLINCGQMCYIIKNYPKYMSELFVVSSLTNSQKEILKLFTRLFGNCARLRDEYGMVSFMDEVLKRLVKSLEKCDDFMKSNFPVINILAEYWRDRSMQGWLKDSLLTMITDFYKDTSFTVLHYESDKIAQFTLTQIQTEKGNEKLNPEEIANRVDKNATHHMAILKKYVSMFVEGVIGNFSKIPYPVRVFASSLNKYMKERFPEPKFDREIKKITLNFIFMKMYFPLLINPKLLNIDISSCHAYESKVLSASAMATFMSIAIKDTISDDKISKILKGEDYAEIAKYTSEKLSKFAEHMMEVSSIEQAYGSVIGLTDEHELNVPQWPMTVDKLCILYSMLNNLMLQKDSAATHGILQKVLDSFESTLTWERFFPKNYDIKEEAAKSTTLIITLIPVPDPEREEERKIDDMLAATKKILIDVLNCVAGDNLKEILSTSITSEHEAKYQQLLEKRQKLFNSVAANDKSVTGDKSSTILVTYPSIQEAISVALANIKQLISVGKISDTPDLCDLVLMLARDVKMLRQLRKARADDVIRMRDSLDSMQKKKDYLQNKKTSLEAVLTDISSQMDNPKSKKVIKKKLEYFIAKEIFVFNNAEVKKKVMSSLSGKTANVSVKKNANGTYSLSVQAAGAVVSSYDFSYGDLNRFQAMNQNIIDMDDYCINVNFLLNFINNHFSLV